MKCTQINREITACPRSHPVPARERERERELSCNSAWIPTPLINMRYFFICYIMTTI